MNAAQAHRTAAEYRRRQRAARLGQGIAYITRRVIALEVIILAWLWMRG